MSTKSTICHGEDPSTGVDWHVYEDGLDKCSGFEAVHLRLGGVMFTADSEGSVDVRMPRHVAIKLGLVEPRTHASLLAESLEELRKAGQAGLDAINEAALGRPARDEARSHAALLRQALLDLREADASSWGEIIGRALDATIPARAADSNYPERLMDRLPKPRSSQEDDPK